jgi:PHD/YefM family antitoxin component YafN of YafNO toxin-antitoxin module
VLVCRLEEYRRDKERVYLREQKRLRQKYRNVVHQLEHEQTMELGEKTRLSLLHPY